MTRPKAIFLLNLVQDVNVSRPLMVMAARDFDFDVTLLIYSNFVGRDLYGIWQSEVEQICHEIGAEAHYYSSDFEAFKHLTGTGVIFAASESNLPAHSTTHNVFHFAPPTFLKVTLQHGFECIGFRHSGDHDLAHGKTASFGADLVCAWYGVEGLASMAPSQWSKLCVTGPTAVLQQPGGEVVRAPDAPGIVCENLHSVRLNIAGDFRSQFVDAFGEFCGLLRQERRNVVLRPHPGGQYILKNKVVLPPNARLNNAPMYKLDLRKFSYGISAPSSVLIDMLLADIPTAVWRDREGEMDAGSYSGLTVVSNPAEWLEFSRAAAADPQPFVDVQRRFLADQRMPLDPREVFMNFAEIFRAARKIPARPRLSAEERDRILFVANANVPTLQLSFEKPLAALVERGTIVTDLLTEGDLRQVALTAEHQDDVDAWIDQRLAGFDPRLIIFCRYSGPFHEQLVDWARRRSIPIMYHIDDDLLAIPPDIGERKHQLHNAPERLQAVESLLKAADLVYASTQPLGARLLEYFPDLPVDTGKIYCSGAVLRTPAAQAARKVGYMASADHAHNLTNILPAIVELLDRNTQIDFEFFGSIPIPAELERFGNRVTTAPPISNYGEFLEEFAKRNWDVGICPLTPIDFNMMKANTKWVEYTSAGTAVVASRGTVYDECCADGCGILADTPQEWLDALELLVSDEAVRLEQVNAAQRKLETEYSVARLREQVVEKLNHCRALASQRRSRSMTESEPAIVA